MVHIATIVALLIVILLAWPATASISTARLQVGDSFLIQESQNAPFLVRDVSSGRQKMSMKGRNAGKWIDKNGDIVNSSNFKLYRNGSVLIKSARIQDAGTYQKDPNPMIRIGDMGYAPPILIVQVGNGNGKGR